MWRNSRQRKRADRIDPAAEKRKSAAGDCEWNLSAVVARFAWRGAITVRSAEAAALFSAQLWDVPEQIRKSLEENKLLRKQKEDALDELAELMALADLHSQPETNGRKIIVRAFSDRDIGFAKLFAQKVTRAGTPAIALVASTMDPPGLVFAQTAWRHGWIDG